MHQCIQRPCEYCKHSAESRACISRILLLPLCICSNRKAEKLARNLHPVPSCTQQTRRLFFFSFNTRGPLAMQITYSSYISASGVFTPDTTTRDGLPRATCVSMVVFYLWNCLNCQTLRSLSYFCVNSVSLRPPVPPSPRAKASNPCLKAISTVGMQVDSDGG